MTTSYQRLDALATEAEAKAHRAWVVLQTAHPFAKKTLRKYHKNLCENASHLRHLAEEALRTAA